VAGAFETGQHVLRELGGRPLEPAGRRGRRFDLDRYVVLELGAVGGVQVDVHRGIPCFVEGEHGVHLRCLGLGVIAIQIEILRGGAKSHLLGAALIGPLVGPEPLVAIDVEHRDEHRGDRREGARQRLAFEQLVQGQKAAVLAVDLARVNTALKENHRAVLVARRLRGEHAIRRRCDGQHGAPFWGGAESNTARPIGI